MNPSFYNFLKDVLLELDLFSEKNIVNIIRDHLFLYDDLALDLQMSQITLLSSKAQVISCVDNISKNEGLLKTLSAKIYNIGEGSVKVDDYYKQVTIITWSSTYITAIACINDNYIPARYDIPGLFMANLYRLCDNEYYLKGTIPPYIIYCNDHELSTWTSRNHIGNTKELQQIQNEEFDTIVIIFHYHSNNNYVEALNKFHITISYMIKGIVERDTARVNNSEITEEKMTITFEKSGCESKNKKRKLEC